MSAAPDPFADPVAPTITELDVLNESVLAVGNDASLTLSADSLVVVADDQPEESRSICGIRLPTRTRPVFSIPYYNVLSANLTNTDIVVRYATQTSKSSKSHLYVHSLIYPISSPPEYAEKWVAILVDRAYGPAQRSKRIKVLVNPYGGLGRAGKQYDKYCAPIFEAAGCIVDVEYTKYKGHAIEIAEHLDITAYDVLACASGDGIPMESFNGLAKKPNASEALRKIAVAQLPCGTGNAMSWNLAGTAEPSLAALAIVKGVRTPLDLCSITQSSTPHIRTLSFLSQSIGIVAETDLGTDNIRWMGDFRFTYGFLVRLLGKTVYPIDIAVRTEIEDKTEIKRHYACEIEKRRKLDLGSHEILDKELEITTALGLPPLKYGTIADPLPQPTATSSGSPLTSGWSSLTPYPNLGNFYCGNMCYMAADAPFFPASLPNDGMLDLVTIDGDIGRMQAVSLLLDVEQGKLMDRECVRYRKVSCVRVIPKFGWAGAEKQQDSDSPIPPPKKAGILARYLTKLSGGVQKEGYFSVDGEKLPFEPFQIEVHRGLGTVLSKTAGLYEYASGPRGWQDVRESQQESATTAANSSS